LVTVSIVMVALSPQLALVAALVMLPLVLITRFFQVRLRDAERGNRHAVGLLNAHLQESLGGVEVVRAFRREAAFGVRFRRTLRQVLAASNRATGYSAFYPPVTAILAATATALLLWVGTHGLFVSWEISLGTLTAFVLLFQRFFEPIIALGEEWQTVQAALAGAERIFRVLALPAEEMPVAVDRELESHAGPAIELREVVFGYVPGRSVLHGITLTVQPGEHVAVVGRTGAGKSSTLHLLGGLYQPWSGAVRVAGSDPRTLGPDEQRRVTGVVPQVAQLFSGTVLENLTLDDASVTLEAVQRAAAIAGADAFIRALPQGYDTPLSGSGRSSGAQLSVGQRQLLALARALVWEPAVLLLDEATATVDSVSEAAFREALRHVVRTQGCAVLTVAHRLSTAREADRVVVMEGGRIVEEGAPDELARRSGRFAALLELEAAGWDWRTTPGSEQVYNPV
jgi:ATP-binding cassette subfamily B protein